jgi:amino acid transporter
MASVNEHQEKTQAPPDDSHPLRDIIVGPPRDVHDPTVFHRLSLAAFLAWVGLGADGMTSSCYGPEEAFLALGHHQYLAIFLGLLTALTVFIISASYSQIIDLFPTGGGGYIVATDLLGPRVGLISGCALVIDYILTITVSIASGSDALFSLFPLHWQPFKLTFSLLVLVLLITINLRGLKESVTSMLPIFVAFVVMHVGLIVYGLSFHAAQLPGVIHSAVLQAHADMRDIGGLAVAFIFLRAYSLGGGTYTGIEAVSNGLPILREPRTVTGKHAMAYMAVSLAFLAAGILSCYLLFHVAPVPGLTLNAVLFDRLAGAWHWHGIAIGSGIVTFTLLTEGSLLFVAAQTGFTDGPRVLATMAADRWLPRRLANLSVRLVTQDGVFAIGVASALILIGTRGAVSILVGLYAINVFITFTLSQLGMSVHWWQTRKLGERRWMRKLAINGIGCVLTSAILVATVIVKFDEGAWTTLLITGALVLACQLVRRHYDRVAAAIARLEAQVLPLIRAAKADHPPPEPGPDAPTAALLVNRFNGLGLATLLNLTRLFKGQYAKVVFLGVAEVNSRSLRGPKEIERLESDLANDLKAYCQLAMNMGYNAESRMAVATDTVDKLHKMCLELADQFPNVVFFCGKLVFGRDTEGFLSRFLHDQVPSELQSLLQVRGLSLVILPARAVPEERLDTSGGPRIAEPLVRGN